MVQIGHLDRYCIDKYHDGIRPLMFILSGKSVFQVSYLQHNFFWQIMMGDYFTFVVLVLDKTKSTPRLKTWTEVRQKSEYLIIQRFQYADQSMREK